VTPQQRHAAFLREQTRQLAAWNAERRAGAGDVMRILKKADAKVQGILKNAPTDWQGYQKSALQRAIERAMEETALELKKAAGLHQNRAFAFGRASLDSPLGAAGFKVELLAPVINTGQLSAMRTFMTGRMENIAARAVRKINDQLGLVMAGAQDPTAAMNSISVLLQGDRGRALTVMRTEIGRAYSVAAQESMEASSRVNPGLKKQWRMSGKIRRRPTHEAAHGQIRNINKPFDIGGEELMFPRDPNGSLGNTINCGCLHVAHMGSWEVAAR
jgi:hypothetical protein